MKLRNLQFATILFGLEKIIKHTAKKYPTYAERLKEKNFTARVKVADDSAGRYFTFKNGTVRSKNGIHSSPDVCLTFQSAELAVKLLMPLRNYLHMINAMKNFQIGMQAPDELAMWFMETVSQIETLRLQYGTELADGVKRFTSNTNGGPVFVYVKEDKILRITPIEFDDSDAGPWTIEARGRKFTPPRSPASSALASLTIPRATG
jgi:trimethylamine-N-oxide reductase (cytochrome c)